jgi:hypothetical protein
VIRRGASHVALIAEIRVGTGLGGVSGASALGWELGSSVYALMNPNSYLGIDDFGRVVGLCVL